MTYNRSAPRIFIVGLPRTGSTLLRTILNRGENTCICAETHYLTQYSRIGRKKKLARMGDLHNAASLNKFLDDLYSARNAKSKDFWGWLNRNFPREEFRRRLLQETDLSDCEIFDLLMRMYAERMKNRRDDGLVLGEKTAANIYHLPQLLTWYPNAKFVHTFRDPRGIFVSAAKLVQAGKWGFRERIANLPGRMADPLLESLMVFYISRAWFDAARLHAQYAQQYPEIYRMLRFEDFLQNPARETEALCEFLNLPFQEGMLENVNIVGSSYAGQRIVAGGIDPQARERWKEHIHPLAKVWFSVFGRDQLKQFGYYP